MSNPRVYISGPMTGVVNNNEPEFNKRASALGRLGFDVVSPIELDKAEKGGIIYNNALRRDVVELMGCEFITMLDGWQRSYGATVEHRISKEVGIKEIDEHGKEVQSRTILEEAQELIGGDRQRAYGHPSVDFSRTAAFWSSYLGCPVVASDVPMMMVLLKTSRERNKHSRDNLVDIAGYAGTRMMLE